jgi:hypothetical protein
VANAYFANDQRNVLLIDTKGGAEDGGEDPQFAQAVQMIKGATDAGRLEQMIGMFSMQVESIEDPTEKEQVQKLIEIAGERLKELKAAAEN